MNIHVKSDLWEFDENGNCDECELYVYVHAMKAECCEIARFFTGINCREKESGCFKKPDKWELCTHWNVKAGDTVRTFETDEIFKVIHIHNNRMWLESCGNGHNFFDKIENCERLIK